MGYPQILMSLSVALIAGLFALRQIRFNNITNARMKWLDNLKSNISEFISECMQIGVKNGISDHLHQHRLATKESMIPEHIYQFDIQIIDHLKFVSIKYDLIKLNLNPKELLHLKMEHLLDEYMEMLNSLAEGTMSDNKEKLKQMKEHCDLLVLLARYIMKIEWEKVKLPYLLRCWYTYVGAGRRLLKEAMELSSGHLRNPWETKGSST